MGSGMCIVYAPATFAHDDETKAVVERSAGRSDRRDPNVGAGLSHGRDPTRRERRSEQACCSKGSRSWSWAEGRGSAAPRRCASPRRAPGCRRRRRPRRGQGDGALIEEAGGTARRRAVRRVAGSRRRRDDRARGVDQFGRLDILFNNVGIPTPRSGPDLEDHTVEDFDRLFAVNFRGCIPRLKHAVLQFKKQGGGGVILNTGSVAGLVGWGGSVYGATKGAVHQLTRAVGHRGRTVRHPGQRDLPGRDAVHQLHDARGMSRDRGRARGWRKGVGSMHPLGRPITAEDCAEAAVYLVSDGADNVTGALLPGRRRVRRAMTTRHGRRASCSTSSGCGGSSTCAAASSRTRRRLHRRSVRPVARAARAGTGAARAAARAQRRPG